MVADVLIVRVPLKWVELWASWSGDISRPTTMTQDRAGIPEGMG